MRKALTYEQARAYIAGEEFGPVEYEREHLIMLRKSAEKYLNTIESKYRENLKETVRHWIELHTGTQNIKEFNELKRVYDLI